MIKYRQNGSWRVNSSPAPQAPFFERVALLPYSGPRAAPIAIDYVELTASVPTHAEVSISTTFSSSETDRLTEAGAESSVHVLIESTELAETIFRKGEEAISRLSSSGQPVVQLISSIGAVPRTVTPATAALLISTWPADLERIEELMREAGNSGIRWGVVVPLLHPVTTNLQNLEGIADLATHYGASSLSAFSVDAGPATRRVLAETELDQDAYDLLFHGDLEALTIATERHVAALATERNLIDFAEPPGFQIRTNWNAAVLLTLTGNRMIKMDREVELGWSLIRSARAVARLDKSLSWIAGSTSLALIDGMSPVAADVLDEWLAGQTPSFVEKVFRSWRLRRDHIPGGFSEDDP